MKRQDILLIIMLAAVLIFLRLTDIFLRHYINKKQRISTAVAEKSIEHGWDRDIYCKIANAFLPKWREDILRQRRIIEKNPDSSGKAINAYLKMAELYEKANRIEKAKSLCNQVLKDYPDNPLRKKVYLRLVSIYKGEKSFDKVREINKILIHEFPGDFDVVKSQLESIAIYENEGDYRKAADEYENFLKKYPNIKSYDDILFKTGMLYRKTENGNRAVEIFRAFADRADEGVLYDNARSEIWLYTGEGTCPKKVYVAVKVSAPPRIDGRLTDDCWKKANTASGYDLHKNLGEGEVLQKTETRIVYDNKRLYIGSTCYESKIYLMKANATVRDESAWSDNSVEYFIDTNRDYKSYYQFVVNNIGTMFDTKCSAKGACDNSWNCMWYAKAWRGTKYWSCEIAIPFSSMKTNTPRRNEVWGINLCRNSYTLRKEHSAWSGMEFHNPESFGYLIFR